MLPLSRNADLSPKARDVAAELRKHWNADFDDASAIGRRYRRQDEIGTPYCVTVDFRHWKTRQSRSASGTRCGRKGSALTGSLPTLPNG